MQVNDSQGTAGPKATWREWLGLVVLSLPTLLVSIDVSVLFLALPHLSSDLGADSVQQLWITDIYGFLVAGALVTMGSLGDRIGRRRLLLIGGVGFAAASLLAAFAPTPEMLIVARALLGIAGATLLPSTMALITDMFRNPVQMGVAIAVWGTAFMAGVAIGPVVGGAMLAAFWWGSVFLMAVPVMLLLVIFGPMLLPESKNPAGGRLDLLSVLLTLVTILPVVWGLKDIAKSGWSLLAVGAIVVGVVAGVVFVRRQNRLEDPLVDMKLFTHRALSVALGLSLIVGGLQAGTGLFMAQNLQLVEGLSPLSAGLWLAVPALALMVGINIAPHLARRIRPAYVLAGGLVVSAGGQLMLAGVDVDSGPGYLVFGLSIAYIGVGPAASLLNHVILSTAPPERAGSASSFSGTSGELGVALGIAVLGTIGAAFYSSSLRLPDGLPADAVAEAERGFPSALAAADELPGSAGADLASSAQHAFVSGLNTVAIVCAALFAIFAVLTVVLLRQVEPVTGDPHGAPGPEDSGDTAEDAALAHEGRT